MSETKPKTKGLSNMEDSTSSTYRPATNGETAPAAGDATSTVEPHIDGVVTGDDSRRSQLQTDESKERADKEEEEEEAEQNAEKPQKLHEKVEITRKELGKMELQPAEDNLNTQNERQCRPAVSTIGKEERSKTLGKLEILKSWLDGTNSEEELNICIFLKQLEKDTKSGEKFTLFVIHRDTKIVHAEAIDEYLLNKHRDDVDLKQEIEEILKKFKNHDDIESSIRRRARHVINKKNLHGKHLDEQCPSYKKTKENCVGCIFRTGCQLVMWCGEKVFNVKGSSPDKRNKDASWINIWRRMFEMTLGERCPEELVCKIEIDDTDYHRGRMVGGHMEKKTQTKEEKNWCYILPICNSHNTRKGFNRAGKVMTTSHVAFAVRIPKMISEECNICRKSFEKSDIAKHKKNCPRIPRKKQKAKKTNKYVQ